MSALLVVATFAALGGVASAASLPVTPAESLSGNKVDFPSALAGKSAVCVFGFSKEAGDRTKEWMTRLNQDGVNAWSIANLEKAPMFVRGMIRGSMRKGTPAGQFDHSLVMTKDAKAWEKAVGCKAESLPVVVVFDSAGRIVWTYEGRIEDQSYKELKQRLEAAR